MVTVAGAGSQWSSGDLEIGRAGSGALLIADGGTVSNATGYIDYYGPSLTSEVMVDGAGSTWANNNGLAVGSWGHGILHVTNGGTVSSGNDQRGYSSSIGQYQGSTGEVKVDGAGSTWTNRYHLNVGRNASNGTLEISNGGLVSVAGILTIDSDLDGDGFINMSTGGMLALFGDADDSLLSFLDLISGTDAIRYWDESIADWADITGATYGVDYTLSYLSEGNLAGYTLLTVPEPATLVLVGLAAVAILRRKRS